MNNINKYLNWLEHSIDWSNDVHRGYLSSNGKLKDRVIRHDIMHLLLIGISKSPIKLTFEDEYANATVQAVLEGISILSRSPYSDEAGRQDPQCEVITEKGIRNRIIPAVVRFLTWALTEKGRGLPKSFRDDVSSEFINKYISIAKTFKENFKNEFGEEYISMSIEAIIGIPFKNLKELLDKSARQAFQTPSTFLC